MEVGSQILLTPPGWQPTFQECWGVTSVPFFQIDIRLRGSHERMQGRIWLGGEFCGQEGLSAGWVAVWGSVRDVAMEVGKHGNSSYSIVPKM